MKTVVLALLSSLVFLTGCNTLKETQIELASGNYEQAIRTSVESLRKSRTKKKSVAYIIILEDAYAKAVDRDMRSIERLGKETSGEAFEEVYNTYQALHDRQEYIRPLLPLYQPDTGREAQFVLINYDEALYVSKNILSEDLHQRASALLRMGTKIDARIAYDHLKYLDRINPDYKDTRTLISDAHNKGTDYVFIHLDNHTDHIIPEDLEKDLLQIDAYKLNQHWTVYHSVPLEDTDYDYELVVAIRDIQISPEQIHEKEVIRDRQIKDGFTYELDDNGNVKKDSSGNDIRSDRYITVRSTIKEFTQSKSSKIVAEAEYISNQGGEVIASIPLTSEYIFVHHYCTHNGDLRALDDYYNGLLAKALVPFPSSEQMIYDTGENLKKQLKEIIAANEF
tara:strand:- start:69 stop:1253 length:1185 start_codon:yes stop_codon:yes gene_type:complete